MIGDSDNWSHNNKLPATKLSKILTLLKLALGAVHLLHQLEVRSRSVGIALQQQSKRHSDHRDVWQANTIASKILQQC